MAANFMLKNKNVFEVFLRRSMQNSNLPIASGLRGLGTSSALSTGTFSEEPGVTSTETCRKYFSSYAGWALPKSQQASGQILTMKKFDEFRASQESWSIADENTFERQPEKTFLLGNNAMITTYKGDADEVIYRGGEFQFALPATHVNMRCAALLPDGSFVICDKTELVFFSSNCEYLKSVKLITGQPYAMTVDNNGNIIVGMLDTNTIAVYDSEGSFGGLFHTESGPLSLAITPNDHLLASFVDGSVQLVDLQDATFANTILIKSPLLSPREWQPTKVCCSKEGDIFVIDWGQGAVYQYSPKGDYLAKVCDGLKDPSDIAVSENGRELEVFETGLSANAVIATKEPCVKTFRLGNS